MNKPLSLPFPHCGSCGPTSIGGRPQHFINVTQTLQHSRKAIKWAQQIKAIAENWEIPLDSDGVASRKLQLANALIEEDARLSELANQINLAEKTKPNNTEYSLSTLPQTKLINDDPKLEEKEALYDELDEKQAAYANLDTPDAVNNQMDEKQLQSGSSLNCNGTSNRTEEKYDPSEILVESTEQEQKSSGTSLQKNVDSQSAINNANSVQEFDDLVLVE